jgi:excisionase family DNA binding protein
MSMPQLLDAARLSQILGVKKGTIYDWVRRKKIPHFKLENLVRFDLAEINAWLEEKRTLPENLS